MKPKTYFEKVTNRIGEHIISSNVKEATPTQIQEAVTLHAKGKCPHTIIVDEGGYMYDFRKCAVCGKGLGAI